MHQIDLGKYQVHTDLIEDVLEQAGTSFQKEEQKFLGGTVTRMKLPEEDAMLIGRKKGSYTTIAFEDITDEKARSHVKEALEKEIQFYLQAFGITTSSSCLLVGLGNKKSTPDSLGPASLSYVTVTRHLFSLGLDVDTKYRPLSSIAPGVMANTGVETQEYLLALIQLLKPDFVIAIDALASSSIARVMKTIQLTDTGIHPGSGIGNNRKEISQETIGIPVLAIGVPTVLDAATIVQNTLVYLTKKISYQKEKGNLPQAKFLTGLENTYEEQEDILSNQEKKDLLGIIGTLKEEEQTSLFQEVLTPLGFNLIVTPTEVDALIDFFSEVIGKALENTLHQKEEN